MMADPGGGGVVKIASEAVAGLKSTPGLLMLVVLNGFFCIGATYFLVKQEEFRHLERLELAELLGKCFAPRSGP